MEHIKTALDKKLRGEQKVSFGAVRSCTYQIVVLIIIVEQSFKWWFSFYAKFKDLEKPLTFSEDSTVVVAVGALWNMCWGSPDLEAHNSKDVRV